MGKIRGLVRIKFRVKIFGLANPRSSEPCQLEDRSSQQGVPLLPIK